MAKYQKAQRMLTHDQIWTALDRLAGRAGLSASGLAKRAGLDPTTFNKSKRVTSDGRERWPSTESVAKALAAANASIDSFVQLTGDGDPARRPRGRENEWRRSVGEGVEAPHRQGARIAVAQSRACRPDATGVRSRMDRADRVGEA